MFNQVNLTYSYHGLEPHIDALTMETHYSKHHATYTKNFNDAVEKLGWTSSSVEEILAKLDEVEDESLKTALLNNGGGYYNHNLYFKIMSPDPKKEVSGELKEKIDESFGSLEEFIEEISQASIGRFGSGWGWLSADKAGNLKISSSANQSNPYIESRGEWTPILGIDVWEHAYYLKYKNLRPAYVEAFFQVLDWAQVEELYRNR